MPRQSLTPKKSTQQKNSPLDAVSASELLKALHTLENINMIQEQIDVDLNISFSQKDNFSQDAFNQVDKSSLKTTQKNTRPINQSTCSKSRNTFENKENLQNMIKAGKMNFEFYMSKTQNTIGLKNRTKSPRPSQVQSKTQFKKTFQPTTSAKKTNENNKTLNYNNRTDTKNKSISPLTERSMNVSTLQKNNNSTMIVGKEIRLKTETNERESIQQQNKRHMKTNSSFAPSSKQQTKNFTAKQNRTPRNNIQMQATKLINESKKLKLSALPSSNPLHNLSIHQRNKQYLRQKNQRLAKLCQQIEQKKKQQQKQCTFKPKIINNNANIKPKYNDLCVSRELNDRTHKKCKQGKQNNQENLHMIDCQEQSIKSRSKGQKQQRSNEITANPQLNESLSRAHDETISFDQTLTNTTTVPKTKYKNAKFNILLDLIH